MAWLSIAAVYLIVWWMSFFVCLPFGLRTQDEAQKVILGTTSSAPSGKHMMRALVRTTILSLIIMGFLLFLTRYLGYSFDDVPRMAPQFFRS